VPAAQPHAVPPGYAGTDGRAGGRSRAVWPAALVVLAAAWRRRRRRRRRGGQ
jgi:hypothetical protein